MDEQLEKEHLAHEHMIDRQRVKQEQERAELLQRLDLVQRDHLSALEKVDELDHLLEKQQQLFETKILGLKERVKNYKAESLQLK